MGTDNKMPLIIIAGPTATGKTEVAIKVAEKLSGEIISADSMLIYRHMNIGTGKPTEKEKNGIPHYLMDVVEPDAQFTVAVFQQQARRAIADISRRGKTSLLVGGTGFYINAVIYDYDFGQAEPSREIRDRLLREAAEKGNEAVHDRLKQVDPQTAARIHANNLKRVIRALEIYYQTGARSALRRDNNKMVYPYYDKIFFCLYLERDKLYQRIEERVDKMIKQGLVGEVRELLQRGYHPGLVSMQGLGYKEMVGYLHSRYSLEEAVHMLKRNTRRFAKRQLTWLKRYSNIKWIDMGRASSTDHVAGEIAASAGRVWQR